MRTLIAPDAEQINSMLTGLMADEATATPNDTKNNANTHAAIGWARKRA
jgi:hypothetical protein